MVDSANLLTQVQAKMDAVSSSTSAVDMMLLARASDGLDVDRAVFDAELQSRITALGAGATGEELLVARKSLAADEKSREVGGVSKVKMLPNVAVLESSLNLLDRNALVIATNPSFFSNIDNISNYVVASVANTTYELANVAGSGCLTHIILGSTPVNEDVVLTVTVDGVDEVINFAAPQRGKRAVYGATSAMFSTGSTNIDRMVGMTQTGAFDWKIDPYTGLLEANQATIAVPHLAIQGGCFIRFEESLHITVRTASSAESSAQYRNRCAAIYVVDK